MDDFLPWNSVSLFATAALFLCFVFSGFVRSGLGFGGAALSLPFILLIVDEPVEVLPILSIQLLFFAFLTTRANWHEIDWRYLRQSMSIMIIPKLIGVLGLLFIPGAIMVLVVYLILLSYSVVYIVGKATPSLPGKLQKAWDNGLLMFGGYMSGASLVGAPLIITVYGRHVSRQQLRNTLFVLWIILVSIKLAAFVITGTDLQFIHQLWLLPAAALGHVLGLKLHDHLQTKDDRQFKRYVGVGLLAVTIVGLSKYASGG